MANYKRIFLDGYSYYITIVTHRRNPILVNNIEALREAFRESKRYYEHTIRDEKDYLRCLGYIQDNPVKHGLVEDFGDWEYMSSF